LGDVNKIELTVLLVIAPGKGGTGLYGTNVGISPLDFEAVDAFIVENAIDLLVVGNEDPLVAGIRDFFAERRPGLLVAGPSKEGARLEGSKDFAKEFMVQYGIPTARYRSFGAGEIADGEAFLESLNAPYVLKADGLAAGKGVIIVDSLDEAKSTLREMLGGKFGHASDTVVIEEFLSGIECSVFVLTDGHGGYRILPVAKDYKRIGEGDTGLNTGGMGAMSPVVFADKEFMDKVEKRIVLPTLEGLADRGIDYRGFIFLGLINVGGEPMVIEYNVRMGDPETEAVMPRIDSDLVDLLAAAASGSLEGHELRESPLAAATVIMVSGGYPESYRKGFPIEGLDKVAALGRSIVFHAGTTTDAEGRTLTSGGRVLAVTSLAPTLEEALATTLGSVAEISFEGEYHRRDIGRDLLAYEA
ncbi:MAG: phosphoribosylamine--glycine ligase, partial [Paramuribaculum sp.]|nr:phosphoribosylamine--glycine ligase [Paramuribaculum sp.]